MFRTVPRAGLLHSLMPDKPSMVRGVRGATTVERDEPRLILDETRELLREMLEVNGIVDHDPIASILFTTTKDLTGTFPAEAARELGMFDVPLMCSAEIDVPGRLGLAIRVMLHVNTTKSQKEIRHVYRNGAVVLRPDLVGREG